MTQATEELKAQACFQFGIVRVEGLYTDDLARLTFEPTGSTPGLEGEIKHLKDEEMSRFYPDEMSEIGGVIYHRSFFRPTIDVIYVPPHMCREQWGRAVVFSADANPTTPAKSSEKHSDQPIQQKSEIGQSSANGAKK